ncbi:hypothetical protein COE25_27785 [Bacillus sp. AFS031507]|nr:hypothetical protein COE25_27785 [Bacillus sp. AFS031507]
MLIDIDRPQYLYKYIFIQIPNLAKYLSPTDLMGFGQFASFVQFWKWFFGKLANTRFRNFCLSQVKLFGHGTESF